MYTTSKPREGCDYLRGYHAGYQDGLAAGRAGTDGFPDIDSLPLDVLGLSARAANCLRDWGCESVSDVAGMTVEMIYRVPRLGKVCADEIARKLHSQRIFSAAWETFLLE